MNEKDAENKQIEEFLRKAHLPEPSPELKKRITTEAKKTWIQISSELPWQTSIRRLIVSAAAAVLIIWLTNYSSDYAMVLWRSGGSHVASHQPPELDTLPELSYSPLARHLVSTDRKPTTIDASALRNYSETLRRVLNESQQNGVSKPSAPAEGRSILLQRQSSFNSFS
jgi:hypothetical protein